MFWNLIRSLVKVQSQLFYILQIVTIPEKGGRKHGRGDSVQVLLANYSEGFISLCTMSFYTL